MVVWWPLKVIVASVMAHPGGVGRTHSLLIVNNHKSSKRKERKYVPRIWDTRLNLPIHVNTSAINPFLPLRGVISGIVMTCRICK